MNRLKFQDLMSGGTVYGILVGTGSAQFNDLKLITPLGIASGGSNKALTHAAGAVVWTDADSMELTAAGGSGQFLKSNGTNAPSWVTPGTVGLGDAILSATQTFTGQNTFTPNGVTASSFTATGAAGFKGEGSNITHIAAANIDAGSLGGSVIASSVAVGSIKVDNQISSNTYTGVVVLSSNVLAGSLSPSVIASSVAWGAVFPKGIAAGSLPNTVIISSIAANAVSDLSFETDSGNGRAWSLVDGSWQVCPTTHVVYDNTGWFDTSNGKFTPKIAGRWCFKSVMRWSTMGDQSTFYDAVSFNGNQDASPSVQCQQTGSGTNSQGITCVHCINMNGSTDYVEQRARQGSGVTKIMDMGLTNTAFGGWIKR